MLRAMFAPRNSANLERPPIGRPLVSRKIMPSNAIFRPLAGDACRALRGKLRSRPGTATSRKNSNIFERLTRFGRRACQRPVARLPASSGGRDGRNQHGKNFLTLLHSIGRVRSRVRPVDAAGMAAGPNALRGSCPNREHPFKDGLTQAGSLNPRKLIVSASKPDELNLVQSDQEIACTL